MSGRVLVIDDHPVFRVGMCSVLRALPSVTEVVEAERGEEGLERWRTGVFSLVTIDVSLPDIDGFEVLRTARAEGLGSAAVIVSMHDDRAYRVRAKSEGALGYVAKSAGAGALAECVTRCLAGADGFQAAPHARVSSSATLPNVTSESVSALSATEKRVVALLGRSLTSREIASVLGVSVRTVENHRANACRKLGLRGPHRLLEFALTAAPLLDEK